MRQTILLIVLLLATGAPAETFTVGTYNIERFNENFEAHRLSTQPVAKDEKTKDLVSALRKKNDEDNWEIAQVILDPKFNPDILVIEEGCDHGDLTFFNRRWLNGAYETLVTFPTNTDRNQNLNLMMKKGFKILERKDKYYLEPDSVGNQRGSRLFARGPSFVKVKTPGGYVFWVGVTHMKSKNVGTIASGEQPADGKETAETRKAKIDATEWRNREAKRTHAIIKELEKAGPADVMLLGDMNDAVGLDEYEKEGGGDAIANLLGPPAEGLILVTKPLSDAGQYSFNGYFRDRYRELIDHVVTTKSMKNQIEDVQIIKEGMAPVASDHFPVMVKVKAD